MAQVDPFVINIPKKIVDDPELFPFFDYFVRWAHDMWVRTGAGDDDVGNQYIQELYPWQQPNYQIFDIPITVTSSAHTTAGNEIVVATSNITVTLNSTPEDGEKVIVQRSTTDGNVTVSGTINGDSSFVMLFNYDSYTFVYSISEAEWKIV